MSKLKSVIRYILAIFLTIFIIIFITISIAKSTILDKNFVLNKLDQTAYYVKIYSFVEDNFKKHIQQSGLDESVLDNLITQEQIKEDTEKIITNVYNNVYEEISTEELKQKISKKIEEQTKGNLITTEQKKEIDSFIDDICNEYSIGIAHFNSEKTIFNAYKKVNSIVELLNKVSLIAIALFFVILIIISRHRIYKIFLASGVSLLASGLFFVIFNLFINTNINIQAITVLNDAFSFTIREILDSILNMVNTNGIILSVSGAILIIISSLIHNILKNKNYDKYYNKDNK